MESVRDLIGRSVNVQLTNGSVLNDVEVLAVDTDVRMIFLRTQRSDRWYNVEQIAYVVPLS